MHTGGPKVLEATAEALGLKNGELDASWQALKRVGNLSSGSVLVVLDEVMKNRRPAPGTQEPAGGHGAGFLRGDVFTGVVVVARMKLCSSTDLFVCGRGYPRNLLRSQTVNPNVW